MGRQPVKWFGGKGSLARKLLPLVPPHRTYVEVFGGGAALLFAKPPSPVEVYNDLDSGLVNFFRALRDPERFARFYHLASFTPYSREEYNYCRETWESCDDDVERAYRWFVVARMSFSGNFGRSWGFSASASRSGMSRDVAAWLSALRFLPWIHERMTRVQIEHYDFRKILEIYDTPDTFFYLDPPYVLATRSGGGYKHEMTDDDHADLIERLLKVQGMAMLSGYRNEIYERLEGAGWERRDFETACHATGRTKASGVKGAGAALERAPRTESVWLNPQLTRRSAQRRLF